MYFNASTEERKYNPKELWKFINSIIPQKRPSNHSQPHETIDGKTFKTGNEISKQFNYYFVKIEQRIADSAAKPVDINFTSYLRNPVSPTIVLNPPLPSEILNVKNSLKSFKACGYDNIPALSRTWWRSFSECLVCLLCFCFRTWCFPQIFKTAKVIPIFKLGPRNSVNNYRPISILPSSSKVLEKLIKTRFVNFINKHIFYDHQFGFREKHNVLHALLDVTSYCFDQIQNKKFSALMLMDLRKAFDTVSHKILLKKLCHYGIRGTAHSLLYSYLSNRQQFVSANSYNSTTRPINIGVPQGSILGPLLFLIYVNDLPNALSCKTSLFADDTCLVSTNSTISDLETDCNLQMDKLNKWCDANELQINPTKSSTMLITPKTNSSHLNIQVLYNNNLIECCESCKYLGVVLDNKLNFKHQINLLENKLAKAIDILSKLRYLLPSSTLLLLYHALVQPHILYALPLWGSSFPSYLNKMQRLQNKAIRVSAKAKFRDSITPLYYKLKILKISELREYEMAKLMHQRSKGLLPTHLSSIFTDNSSIRSRFTRSQSPQKLYIPKFSTSRCQSSIRYQGWIRYQAYNLELIFTIIEKSFFEKV